MNDHDEREKPVNMIRFLIDERPHVFIHDAGANLRFLQSIDRDYWGYQSAAHLPGLDSEDEDHRKRAAAALRVAYSQGLETLFALLAALLQCPTFPLGWLLRYKNSDLRSVVRKINANEPFPSFLRAGVSWHAVAAIVHEGMGEPKQQELADDYGTLWKGLAREFAEDHFEPEYNSLKHGMRASVGGFSVSIGLQSEPGVRAPQEKMQAIGGAEYGSTFLMPPRRLPGGKLTYELSQNVSIGWSPRGFASALELIALSIGNVASRALLCAGVELTKAPFRWPEDRAAFDAPWKERPTIGRIGFGGSTTSLRNWREPSKADILKTYPQTGKRTLE